MKDSGPKSPRRGCVFFGLLFLVLGGGLLAAVGVSMKLRLPTQVAWNQGPNDEAVFTPDGRWLVIRTYDAVSVYAPETGACIAQRSAWKGRPGHHGGAVVSPRGDLVACGLELFSLPDLAPRGTLPGRAIGWAPGGEHVAVIGSQGLLLASPQTGAVGTTFILEPWPYETRAAFSPDGKFLATRDVNETVVVARTADGTLASLIDVKGPVGFAFAAPNELVVANRHGGVFVYSANDAKLRNTVLPESVPYLGRGSPGAGPFVLDRARRTFVWKLGFALEVRSLDSGQVVWRKPGMGFSLDSLDLSSDERFVASGGSDFHVAIWRR